MTKSKSIKTHEYPVVNQSTSIDVVSYLEKNLCHIYESWVQTRITQFVLNNRKDNDFLDATLHTLPSTFILSVSDGYKRAKTVTFIIDDLVTVRQLNNQGQGICEANLEYSNGFIKFEQILPIVAKKLHTLSSKFESPIIWLRLEWLNQITPMRWGGFKDSLKRFKRNYYRSGVAFQGIREPWLLATEMELNANACLYQGHKVAHAGVNENNLKVYLRARHGSSQIPEFQDDLPVVSFNTAGVFINLVTDEFHILELQPRNKGRRRMLPLSTDNTAPIIEQASIFLANQVNPSGQYTYGYFPCFNRSINTYNSLRHASSTYALIEGYEACKAFGRLEVSSNSSSDSKSSLGLPLAFALEEIQAQIDKAMYYLTHELIQLYDDKAYVIDTGGEIKLGANAVAILALVKYLQVFEDTSFTVQYHTLAEKLALGILAMQQEDGSFVHVLHSKDLTLKQKNRIIYYDGEAAFALMRLYGLTRDDRWLNCVIRAFDYFIEAKHYRAHDHWLSYCSNELVIYKPEKKYFKFAVDNIKGYTDFIKNRITTFPTLLELSMAFHNMLLKLDEYPEFRDILDGFDIQGFYQALHIRANYLINGFFFPEVAMFYKAPNSILHGFFIRHHSFRVRIDDVEHYLSGLIAYNTFIKTATYPKLASCRDVNRQLVSSKPVLTGHSLQKATKGRWLEPPQSEWQATGLCIWSPSFKQGQLLVARGKNMKTGYLPKVAVVSLVKKGASAIITDDETEYKDFGVPVLKVGNVREATIDIGRYARQVLNGQVIGVTGSAGKTTTVSMLAHTLDKFGGADYTKSSANLPAGIAWNLASMSQEVNYWVMEMAIGSMAVNTDLVRPDVALITNIAPAHLEYHYNLENIALKKARIFEGMLPGSLAVVCRDIDQYDLIERCAHIQGLKVISYGVHKDSTIKLLSYTQNKSLSLNDKKKNTESKGQAIIAIDNQKYTLSLRARGQHMVVNAMAVLAVTSHFNLSIKEAIAILETFEAVSGRGKVVSLSYQNKPITLYDEAYNANPLSMKAALQTFEQLNVPDRQKLLILGDMLELGNNSEKYHIDLAPIIQGMSYRTVIFVGKLSQELSIKLKESGIPVHYFQDSKQLATQLDALIQENDHILIKASHGIGLNKLFLD